MGLELPGAVAFNAVKSYLLDSGWYPDGQDPGLWLPDKVTIGTAFELQLERDATKQWLEGNK